MNNELDLHGVKHADVFSVVDKFIGSHIQKGTREVSIITGFSQGMKDKVQDVLNDYGATYQNAWMNNGKILVNLE